MGQITAPLAKRERLRNVLFKYIPADNVKLYFCRTRCKRYHEIPYIERFVRSLFYISLLYILLYSAPYNSVTKYDWLYAILSLYINCFNKRIKRVALNGPEAEIVMKAPCMNRQFKYYRLILCSLFF